MRVRTDKLQNAIVNLQFSFRIGTHYFKFIQKKLNYKFVI